MIEFINQVVREIKRSNVRMIGYKTSPNLLLVTSSREDDCGLTGRTKEALSIKQA